MKYPATYGDNAWLEEESDNNQGTIIPFFFQLDTQTLSQLQTDTIEGGDWVHSFLWVTKDSFSTHYFDANAGDWVEREQIDLDDDVKVNFTDIHTVDVHTFGPDSEPTVAAYQRLGRTVEELYGLPPFPYDVKSARQMFSLKSPDVCEHEAPTINLEQNVEGGDDIGLTVCSTCRSPFGAITQSSQFSRDALLTHNLDQTKAQLDTISDKVAIGHFKLGHDGPLDLIAGLLTQETQATTRQASDLVNDQDLLLLVLNDVIVGYLSWEKRWGSMDLHQVYIIPEVRKKGFANLLVRYWVRNYVDGNKFYADQPNEKGYRLLESIGESTDGLEIIPYSRFYPVGAEPYKESSVVKTIRNAL